MSKDLRNKLIRLAHSKPELRADLLPLLKEASRDRAIQELIERSSHKAFFGKISSQLDRSFQMYGTSKKERIMKQLAGMMIENSPRKLSIKIEYFIDYDDYGMDPSDPSYDLDGSHEDIEKQHETNKKEFERAVNQIARKFKVPFSFSLEPARGRWGDEIDFGVGIGDDEAWGYMNLNVEFSGKQIPLK